VASGSVRKWIYRFWIGTTGEVLNIFLSVFEIMEMWRIDMTRTGMRPEQSALAINECQWPAGVIFLAETVIAGIQIKKPHLRYRDTGSLILRDLRRLWRRD
jgi:hypothetical protein